MDLRTFAAYLVSKHGDIKGKKAFQKLVYLAKAEGIPFNHAYRLHYYGPYSDAVAKELDAILEQRILTVSSNSYLYKKGENVDKIETESIKEIKQYKKHLERLLERFGNMSPSELEIYATAHFVYRNQVVFERPVDRETVINEIKKAKYPKFTEAQINEAYDNLIFWNLINTQ